MKIKRVGDILMILCPGCNDYHNLNIDPDSKPCWSFNGDLDSPTVSPSILNRMRDREGKVIRQCHSFLESGKMRFLGDCTHGLANQTVPLAEVEE